MLHDLPGDLFPRDDADGATEHSASVAAQVAADDKRIVLPLTDWAQAFNRPPTEAILDGLLIPGRWTALVAPAKAGKSTLALHIAQCLARGVEPFSGGRRDPVSVLYLDGEMGELDVIERLVALELDPAELGRLHYSDMPPKCDVVPGAVAVEQAVKSLGATVVILDGLNAFVTGAEKDDVTWRELYRNLIATLKRAGCAVMSSDNTGKDATLSARGSSVKLDKADAIVEVKRTDDGVKLKTTHRRSSAFLSEWSLAMVGVEGDEPINYRHALQSWPAGTREVVDLLDRLGVPLSAGRPAARAALAAAGESVRNEPLAAAIRYRKSAGTVPGTVNPGQSAGTVV